MRFRAPFSLISLIIFLIPVLELGAGHALGLIPESRRCNVEDKIGLHCTNLCTMRQGMSRSEFVDLALEEEQAGVTFCSECAQYLESGPANLKVLFGSQSDTPKS